MSKEIKTVILNIAGLKKKYSILTTRKKTNLLVLLLTLFTVQVYSQSTAPMNGHFELEVDPIAYLLKGYSLHIGYQKNKFRYDVGIFGVETPKWISSNKDFKERSNGFGLKMDYVGAKTKGWFVGLETDYSLINTTYESNGHKESGEELGLGIRSGYRFLFGKSKNNNKGFYLVPWIGFDKIFNTSKPNFTEATYKLETFRIFPTVHFGWRF